MTDLAKYSSLENPANVLICWMSNKGTFAHPDITFEFASWLSLTFKLYLIKEFERLKKNEAYQEKIEWYANRVLAKTNYLVHTDVIKN